MVSKCSEEKTLNMHALEKFFEDEKPRMDSKESALEICLFDEL